MTPIRLLLTVGALASAGRSAPPPADDPFHDTVPRVAVEPALRTIASDPRLRLAMHRPVTVMSDDGRQPYLFRTSRGTLLCQAQLRAPAFDTKGKFVYHYRIGTAISRDGGESWQRFTARENHDDVYTEGGVTELPDGTILMLDTFVMPAGRKDHGVGELWKSHDDLRTWEGPYAVDFYLPTFEFGISADDRGKPLPAAWMHRSMIRMPNGDLLISMYGWYNGDAAAAAYMPSMKKFRSAVIRSRDQGSHWAYLSTIAVDSGTGTEGFDEPVLLRISTGPHSGRLLCLMRTGREMYGAHSDDDGLTWSRARPVAFPGIDVYQTSLWEHLFVDTKAPDYVPTDQMIGALVDPDLIQMSNGVLVCTVGARIPARLYRSNWRAPQNGNYLAFSLDGGDTWSHVVQFTSGAPTTQYMGIREISPGVLYVVYDDSVWKMPGRAVGFRLEVHRTGP